MPNPDQNWRAHCDWLKAGWDEARADNERLREVVKYLRAVLPPERWADDARKMADAVLVTTVQPLSPLGNPCLTPDDCVRSADNNECFPCDHAERVNASDQPAVATVDVARFQKAPCYLAERARLWS